MYGSHITKKNPIDSVTMIAASICRVDIAFPVSSVVSVCICW